ncbi:MAG: aldo/keto reductase [Tahibacter sp.]
MRLGSWGAHLAPRAVADFLAACADAGVCDVDLANIYGDSTTNRLVGAAFALRPELRARLRLIAKVGIVLAEAGSSGPGDYRYDSSVAGLQRAIAASFTDLGVERIDVLMLHRMDFLTSATQLAELLQPMLTDGRIGAFGVSNATPLQVDLLASQLPVSAHQFELSVMQSCALFDGTHAHSQRHGFDIMAWSPLGGGAALDPQAVSSPQWQPTLVRLCDEHGLTPAQLLLRWVHSVPGTRAVLGTQRIERVIEACHAAAQPLPHTDWYALLEAARGVRLP